MVEISEKSFEQTIDDSLIGSSSQVFTPSELIVGEPPAPYGEGVPGGYHKRQREEYDRSLCFIPKDVVDFILATQPKEWAKLK